MLWTKVILLLALLCLAFSEAAEADKKAKPSLDSTKTKDTKPKHSKLALKKTKNTKPKHSKFARKKLSCKRWHGIVICSHSRNTI
ncbi:hypothetical protein GCK32_021421 [Trichostrongylus colubriformis]|uniref:Uncharacterized protein n=1 Tax=Trichostrongylus colubriformis TaxID=6319 RepID=A0AAN8F2C5_TRICO